MPRGNTKPSQPNNGRAVLKELVSMQGQSIEPSQSKPVDANIEK